MGFLSELLLLFLPHKSWVDVHQLSTVVDISTRAILLSTQNRLALGDNHTSNAKGKLCKADEFVLLLHGLFHTIQVTCVKDFKNLTNRLDQVQNFNIRYIMAIKAV
jgi:hypothetical protein